MSVLQVARIIADFALFLDDTDDDQLDPDTAVEMGEWLGHRLEGFDKAYLRELVDAFAVIAPEYRDGAQQSVRDIPFGYFLEEAIAADDPVRLAELEAMRDARA